MSKTNKEYYKDWWQKNKHKYKDRHKEAAKRYQENHPERRLLVTCRSRSKKFNIEFNIEESDIFIPDMCPVLNKPMKRGTPYAPSIDRIDPAKGYVKDNIQVISRLANVMKNNASDEDLRSFANWVLRNY